MPIPKELREPLIQWYHINLCHSGVDHTEGTIRYNFVWNQLGEDVHNYIKTCDACQ